MRSPGAVDLQRSGSGAFAADGVPLAADAPWFIVMNAGSGNQEGGSVREAIASAFTRAGRRHELRLVEKSRDLAVVARQAVADAVAQGGVVVGAGGDGTLNTVAQAVLGSGRPFGVLALGTFNYFARTHGLPTVIADALQALLNGRPRRVQVGLINDRVFLVNASLGLYPEVMQDREAYKARLGRSRGVALIAGIATLLRHHRQLRLQIVLADGQAKVRARVIRTPTVFVANNRLQLEQLGIDQAHRVDEGELVAVTLRPVKTLTMLWLMLRGAMGQLGEAEQVVSAAFESLTVKPTRLYPGQRIKVSIDGEVDWMKSPLTFRPSPQPLWLIKPNPEPTGP